jgi:hypothetical protein
LVLLSLSGAGASPIAVTASVDLDRTGARARFLLGYEPESDNALPSEADIASARLIDSVDGLRSTP